MIPPANRKQFLEEALSDLSLTPYTLKLVSAVIQTESAWNEKAVSPAGAIGLMQLMPLTAKDLGVDPFSSRDNVRGGAIYLNRLLIKYHQNKLLALAAYNAGMGRVDRLLKAKGAHSFSGIRKFLPVETQSYVPRVISFLK